MVVHWGGIGEWKINVALLHSRVAREMAVGESSFVELESGVPKEHNAQFTRPEVTQVQCSRRLSF